MPCGRFDNRRAARKKWSGVGKIKKGDVLNVRRVSPELLRRARVQAAMDGLTIGAFVMLALANHLAEREKARGKRDDDGY